MYLIWMDTDWGVRELKALTDEEILFLISCPKIITTIPKKSMLLLQGSYRNEMTLQSEDGLHRFSVFMRKNEAFEENFSIGLRYHPDNDPESIVLIRCNGPHGEHRDPFDKRESHYWEYHIHLAKETIIKEGLRSEAYAEITDEYSNYADALVFFFRYCNIKDAIKYFKNVYQRACLAILRCKKWKLLAN